MRAAQASTATVTVPSDTDGTPEKATPDRGGWRGLVRAHWLFGVFLVLGIGLRVVTWLAYQPAIFYTDAYRYLDNIGPENPQYLDPIGYSLYILKPLVPLGGVGLVVAVQHVAGIGMALLIYHLGRKLGARRWLAALATAPVLLDAYQLQIEQQVLTDVWLEVMLVVLLWLLLGRQVPAAGWFALAGLAVGLAMTIRIVAISVIIPVAIYAVLAGRQWRVPGGWRRIAARVGALGGCFLVVVAAYATYFHSKAGYWGLNTASGNAIYGRTAEVADCSKLDLDEVLQQLCPKEPLGHRLGTNVYSHLDGFRPGWPGYVPPGETIYDLDKKFAKQVILHQPVTVAVAVLEDFGKGFLPYHFSLPGDPPTWLWQFSKTTPVFTVDPTSNPDGAFEQTNAYAVKYGHKPLHTIAPLAAFLHYYQFGGYTPGPLLFGMLVLGLIGGFSRRGRRSGLAGVTLLTTGVVFTVLFTAALFEFSWRYQLPGLVLLPLAGVLGITALIRGRAAVSAPPPAD
ncbi:MAG TPA: hypothetical protein VFW65_25620 [Pseudonocardiaceae bacterium]|nr:hypothetical protein [Pseudonocardiaceae bacterium]